MDPVSRATARRDAADRTRLARFGETLAADFLRRRGARILARNLRVGHDEIDLLVRFRRCRALVEVKTGRGGREVVDPAEHLDDRKLSRLRRAAGRLVPPVSRIDLVVVVVDGEGVTVRWSAEVE